MADLAPHTRCAAWTTVGWTTPPRGVTDWRCLFRARTTREGQPLCWLHAGLVARGRWVLRDGAYRPAGQCCYPPSAAAAEGSAG